MINKGVSDEILREVDKMVRESKRRLRREQERLEDETLEIRKEDRELLAAFNRGLSRDPNIGETHHAHRLISVISIAGHREEPVTAQEDNITHGVSIKGILDSKEKSNKILDWINDRTTTKNGIEQPLSDRAREHYRGAIRALGKHIGDNGRPQHIEDISTTVSNKPSDPTPNPNSILYWDDHITEMVKEQHANVRDAALIAVAWDSGARPWEIKDLRTNNISDNGDYILITIVDGKTGTRDARLIPSMPYLKKWLGSHPANEYLEEDENLLNQDYPLWTPLKQSRKLKSHFKRIARTVANRAGISRPGNLRQMRRSRASILASAPEVSEEDLRIRFGWGPKSDAPAHYKARFSNRADDHIANFDGADIQIAEEHEDAAPVKCPQCQQWTPRHLTKCFWCQSSFSIKESTENQKTILDQEARFNRERAKLLAEVGTGEIDPQTLERAMPFAEVLDEDPDILDDAREFLEKRGRSENQ